MTAEAILGRHLTRVRPLSKNGISFETKRKSIFEYPECSGHPASSSYNWVLTDYLGYCFAKLLSVTDEDIRQKQKNSSIIEPK